MAKVSAISALFIIAVVSASGCTSTQHRQAKRSRTHDAIGPRLFPSDRVLIVAPHPDDETIGTGGIIQQCLKNKIPLKVVLMTNGDGYRRSGQVYLKVDVVTSENYRQLGHIRHMESLAALKTLGLNENDVAYLSYADGSINNLFNTTWDYDKSYVGLNGATQTPYDFAYEANARYCGENVVKNLSEIVQKFKPTVLVYPDPQDDHLDHWATSAFAEYVMTKVKYDRRQYSYLVHKGYFWPFPWAYTPAQSLEPPPELAGLDAVWLRHRLTQPEEKLKDKALAMYTSQSLIGDPFLRAFVRKNELFAYYPDVMIRPVSKKPDFFRDRRMPSAVFQDPPRDTLVHEWRESGDILCVGFAMRKDNTWLAIQTRQDISPDVMYGYHMRIFEDDKVKRVDVNVMNGVAGVELIARDSIGLKEQIPVTSSHDRLVIQLPTSLFQDSWVVMLNVDTYSPLSSRYKRIDRTAWRRLFIDSKRGPDKK